MTVYRLQPDNLRFHNFALVDERCSAILHEFDGRPVVRPWVPLAITASDTDDELAATADHALLGAVPVFSERATTVLDDILSPNGELLPLSHPQYSYFAYNVTRVIDALDESRSNIHRFSTGRVLTIDSYAFHAGALRGSSVFKIPQQSRAIVFATEVFRDRVNNSRLTGFVFEQLWTNA